MKSSQRIFLLSVLDIIMLSLVIVAVSVFFIERVVWIGPVLIVLALISLASLIPFKISLKSVMPDVFFGLIDNSILATLAIFGGYFAGVTGAIIGGVVGNAITDGVAGIFEGRLAEKLREHFIPEQRTMLKSAVGKMTGCLLGAGVILIISSIFKL